jgi:hypothetical protein
MAKPQVLSSDKMQSSEQASSLDSTCFTPEYILTDNLPGYVNCLFKELIKINPFNAKIIRNYIEVEKVEINIKESTKADKIKKLCWLSRYLNHKSFKSMTKRDVINYLDSIKKPDSEDPGHRSIGTYNGIRIVLLEFFNVNGREISDLTGFLIMDSETDPRESIVLTFWKSKESMTSFYNRENPTLEGLVNNLKPLFSEMPARFDYKVILFKTT